MSVVVQVGDVFAVRLGFRDVNNNVAYNVLHYRCDSITPTPPAVYQGESVTPVANNLAEVIFDNLSPVWQPLASIEVGFDEVMVQSVYPLPKSRQYYYIPAVAADGTVNEDALPLQDTPTLVKRTEFGARWGVGRIFVVGLPESANNVGIIDPAFEVLLGAFAAVLDDVQTATVAGTNFAFVPVLFGAPPEGSQVPRISELTSIALGSNTFKTQRRRRPGKGI